MHRKSPYQIKKRAAAVYLLLALLAGWLTGWRTGDHVFEQTEGTDIVLPAINSHAAILVDDKGCLLYTSQQKIES